MTGAVDERAAADGERARRGRPPHPSRLARAGTMAWQLIGVVLVLLFAGWAAGRLMPVLLPFGIAILLAALLRPLTAWLQRRGLPAALAALITMIVLVAVVGGLVYLVVPPFVARVAELGSSITEGVQKVAYTLGSNVGMSHAEVDQAFGRALARLRQHVTGIAGEAVTGAAAAATVLGAAVLVLFICFFLLEDGRRMWGWIVRLAPRDRRRSLWEVGGEIWTVLQAYIRGVVFVATVDAVFIGIALLLVGVPLALPLIVLTWLAAFFPIVGAITAGAAAVLVALVAKGLGAALIILAAIVAVQQIEGNVLYPVVVGPRLRLHAIVVLLAVAAGGTIAGLPGAFLAVPVATVCAAVLDHVREPEGGEPPPAG
jgi:predicted PurR-regulated permease PerM